MAKIPDVATIDFETEAIAPHPYHPPKPVGVSIMLPGERRATYHAWGHPTHNNCDLKQGRRELEKVYKSGLPILCHNAKFDLDVAEKHLDLPVPSWEGFHDTMFLLFLDNPYEDLGLKPCADRLLGMPPEERDILRDWLVENKLIAKNVKRMGHMISQCPGNIVGDYANGDVIRTYKLFKKLWPNVSKKMLEAYNRDRRLLPILLRNEREGVRVDVPVMSTDWKSSVETFKKIDGWVCKRLKCKNLNIDSNDELADALVAAGKADETKFLMTPKGERSVDKESLKAAVTDAKVLQLLQYRSKLGTSAGTFLGPWLKEAEANDGIVHPSWNQVRQPGKAKFSDGARTGRLTAPRFMNVPKEFEEDDNDGGYQHPDFLDLPQLPNVRMYMLPDKSQLWGKRDYSQQELRVLGHFEDGVLLENYIADPTMDVHALAARMVTSILGVPCDTPELFKQWRSRMKTVGFGLLYGMGLGALAERLNVDVKTAQQIKRAYLDVFPGLKDLQNDLKVRGQTGVPMRTWGGREYLCEPPKFIESRGRMCTFEYKLFNYLIQGSSADCTKEAIIRYDDMKEDGRFLVTVHDEINISAPKSAMKHEMGILRDVMASIEFDVPMLSDGAVGVCWGNLTKFEE